MFMLLFYVCSSSLAVRLTMSSLVFLLAVPGQPLGPPTLKTKSDNSSVIVIDWHASDKPAGPTFQYIVNVNSSNYDTNFTVPGSCAI